MIYDKKDFQQLWFIMFNGMPFHSCIDVLCGAAVSLVLYAIAYYMNWHKILEGIRLKILL